MGFPRFLLPLLVCLLGTRASFWQMSWSWAALGFRLGTSSSQVFVQEPLNCYFLLVFDDSYELDAIDLSLMVFCGIFQKTCIPTCRYVSFPL